MKIKFKKFRPIADPIKSTKGAAAWDLHAALAERETIRPGKAIWIPTGVGLELPKGYVGIATGRSGWARKRSVVAFNPIGVIDSDYRGEIFVSLQNFSSESWEVLPGDRVAQLLILKLPVVELVETQVLEYTDRGVRGFGSTGV